MSGSIDETGVEVGATTVVMDTFYARTDAFVEVSLATLLAPGDYVARIDIGDSLHGVPVETVAVDLVVDQPTAGSIGTGAVPGVDGVLLDLSDGQVLVPVPVLVLVAILVLALALAASDPVQPPAAPRDSVGLSSYGCIESTC